MLEPKIRDARHALERAVDLMVLETTKAAPPGSQNTPGNMTDALELRQRKTLEDIAKTKERIQTLETSIFQLANYYFVFQGVVFTAVFSGSSHVKCHFRYVVLSLSLIAAFLNLVALIFTGERLVKLLKDLGTQVDEWNTMVKRIEEEKETNCSKEKETNCRMAVRYVVLILTLCLMTGFASVNAYGTLKILCYENQQCICSSKECVKLCN